MSACKSANYSHTYGVNRATSIASSWTDNALQFMQQISPLFWHEDLKIGLMGMHLQVCGVRLVKALFLSKWPFGAMPKHQQRSQPKCERRAFLLLDVLRALSSIITLLRILNDSPLWHSTYATQFNQLVSPNWLAAFDKEGKLLTNGSPNGETEQLPRQTTLCGKLSTAWWVKGGVKRLRGRHCLLLGTHCCLSPLPTPPRTAAVELRIVRVSIFVGAHHITTIIDITIHTRIKIDVKMWILGWLV